MKKYFIALLVMSNLTTSTIKPIEPQRYYQAMMISEILSAAAHFKRISAFNEKSESKIKKQAVLAGITSIIALLTKNISSLSKSNAQYVPLDLGIIKDSIEAFNAYAMYKNAEKIASLNAKTPHGSFPPSEKTFLQFLLILSRPSDIAKYSTFSNYFKCESKMQTGNPVELLGVPTATLSLKEIPSLKNFTFSEFIAGILFGCYELYLQSKYFADGITPKQWPLEITINTLHNEKE